MSGEKGAAVDSEEAPKPERKKAHGGRRGGEKGLTDYLPRTVAQVMRAYLDTGDLAGAARQYGVNYTTAGNWCRQGGWRDIRKTIDDEVAARIAADSAQKILDTRETALDVQFLALTELRSRLMTSRVRDELAIRELTSILDTMSRTLNSATPLGEEIWELVSNCPQPASS